jgi:hypothetical protein
MTIQIEDYNGNDLITLCYNQISLNRMDEELKVIDKIVQVDGYNVADLEDEWYFRVQAVEVIEDEVKSKDNLINLIERLNKQFL